MRGAPRHPMNAALHHKLASMMRQATIRHAYSELQAIKKAVHSLERCPVPILSSWQLSSLEGFGPKLTAAAEKVLKELYAEYLDHEYDKRKAMEESENIKEALSAQNERELTKQLVKVKQVDSQDFQYKRSCTNEPKIFSKGSWIMVALYDADSIIENIREPIYRSIQDVLEILEKKSWSKKSKEKDFKKTLLTLIKHRFVGVSPVNPEMITLTDNGRQVGKYHHYLVNNRNKIDLSEISVKDDTSHDSSMSRSASSVRSGAQFIAKNFINEDRQSALENNSYYSYNSENRPENQDNVKFKPSADLEDMLDFDNLEDFIFNIEVSRSKSVANNDSHTPTMKHFRSTSIHNIAHTQQSEISRMTSQQLDLSYSSAEFGKSLKSSALAERKEKPPFRSLRDNIRVDAIDFRSHTICKNDISKCEIILLVDSREKKRQGESSVSGNYFKEKLGIYGIPAETCNLPIGDFLWVLQVTGMPYIYIDKRGESVRYVLDYIIERKLTTDLISSIADGRYQEQKNRLLMSGLRNVMYLIEGMECDKIGDLVGVRGSAKRMLEGAMMNVRMFNKFSVLKSKDINSTIKYLSSLHKSILELENSKLNRQDDESPIYLHCTYQDFLGALKKSEVCTTGTIFCNILRNIRGFGKETVERINSQFKSFQEAYIFLNGPKRDPKAIIKFMEILNKDQKPRFIKSLITTRPEVIYALL